MKMYLRTASMVRIFLILAVFCSIIFLVANEWDTFTFEPRVISDSELADMVKNYDTFYGSCMLEAAQLYNDTAAARISAFWASYDRINAWATNTKKLNTLAGVIAEIEAEIIKYRFNSPEL